MIFAAALVLGRESARRFSVPNLLGFSGGNLWSKPDFWFSAGSSAFALAATIVARSSTSGRRTTASERIFFGFALAGLTTLLLPIWWSWTLYYALWIAPTHALAATSLVACFRRALDHDRRARAGFGGST